MVHGNRLKFEVAINNHKKSYNMANLPEQAELNELII